MEQISRNSFWLLLHFLPAYKRPIISFTIVFFKYDGFEFLMSKFNKTPLLYEEVVSKIVFFCNQILSCNLIVKHIITFPYKIYIKIINVPCFIIFRVIFIYFQLFNLTHNFILGGMTKKLSDSRKCALPILQYYFEAFFG